MVSYQEAIMLPGQEHETCLVLRFDSDSGSSFPCREGSIICIRNRKTRIEDHDQDLRGGYQYIKTHPSRVLPRCR
jgi:hypothetical protein